MAWGKEQCVCIVGNQIKLSVCSLKSNLFGFKDLFLMKSRGGYTVTVTCAVTLCHPLLLLGWSAINHCLAFKWASLVAQMVRRLPAMRETWVWSLGWEDPLKKEMATQSSTLAWRIPWMEEPGGLQSWGRKACRHGHNIPINSRPSIHKFSFQAFPHSPPPFGTQSPRPSLPPPSGSPWSLSP